MGAERRWWRVRAGDNPCIPLSPVFKPIIVICSPIKRELMRGARLWSVRAQSGHRR